MNVLELLAPAKNYEYGVAAIKCGADAVYIGAPAFGARKAAAVPLQDIEQLIDYAHLYRVKVYVALNTILTDYELDQARLLINILYELGVDALIIQDMGLLERELPPIPLFASTQTHNMTPEKVKFLEQVGFSRVILARELSYESIASIRAVTTVPLEVFVHGALCVGYSGQCYLSYINGGRSGNRGDCAQPCRNRYRLETEDGVPIGQGHLLSVKDLNLSAHLEPLIDAGITSFKIEGRLKDLDYVKNIVAYYRYQLDQIIERRQYARASSGRCRVDYQPDPIKTFNRGYTDYFLYGKGASLKSANSPKSIGEHIGVVMATARDHVVIAHGDRLHAGDGLCYFVDDELSGTRVNRVDGEMVFVENLRGLQEGIEIYRNSDQQFAKAFNYAIIERKVGIEVDVRCDDQDIIVTAIDEDGVQATVRDRLLGEKARDPEQALLRFQEQFAKLGDTIFMIKQFKIYDGYDWFMPVGKINELRRRLVLELLVARQKDYTRTTGSVDKNNVSYPEHCLDYTANVLNESARSFYNRHGASVTMNALESGLPVAGVKVMTTKLCLKRELGLCARFGGKPFDTPLVLVDEKLKKYRLDFRCETCEMEIYN